MLRIIVRVDDCAAAANVGGAVDTTYKSFDVELPELEKYLRGKKGRSYLSVGVGVELLEGMELLAAHEKTATK